MNMFLLFPHEKSVSVLTQLLLPDHLEKWSQTESINDQIETHQLKAWSSYWSPQLYVGQQHAVWNQWIYCTEELCGKWVSKIINMDLKISSSDHVITHKNHGAGNIWELQLWWSLRRAEIPAQIGAVSHFNKQHLQTTPFIHLNRGAFEAKAPPTQPLSLGWLKQSYVGSEFTD